MIEKIISEAITALIAVAATFTILFWKGYIRQKSRNTANIENAEELTAIKEAVKNTFKQEFAKIQIANNQRGSILTEERNAIVNYNECLYALLSNAQEIIYYHYNEEEFQGIIKKNRELQEKYRLSMARMKLFFDATDLKNLLELEAKIYIQIDKMHKTSIECFGKCNSITNVANTYFTHSPKVYNESISERVEVIDEFTNTLHEQHNQLLPDLQSMREVLYKMIEKVFSDRKN